MNADPILDFRLSAEQQPNNKSYIYAFKSGIHLTLDGFNPSGFAAAWSNNDDYRNQRSGR